MIVNLIKFFLPHFVEIPAYCVDLGGEIEITTEGVNEDNANGELHAFRWLGWTLIYKTIMYFE